ncbi:hypothetical protein FRC12_024921 [Ceratobasidium sp. 428]|nr:hypothetical protein FRC12_024921 [Ceratobasidium sp. 428]
MSTPIYGASRFESARKLWEDAGLRLFAAFSDYQDALSALEDASYILDTHPDRRHLPSRIDCHLTNLDSADPRAQLNRLRNRRKAHINTLPIEVLIDLFYHCIDQAQPVWVTGFARPNIYRRTTALVSVCKQWRRIILDLPAFWSLVNLSVDNHHQPNLELARLWLERSSSAPLHIVLNLEYTYLTTSLPILVGHASRFRTLSIVTHCLSNVYEIMSCWFGHGAPGSVTELSVCLSPWNGSYDSLLPLDVYKWHSRDKINSFLRPLRILRLGHVYLNWDSAAYDDLFELRLETKARMQFKNLAKILRASPMLLQLTLKDLCFKEPIEPLADPISLPCLRSLYLDDIRPHSLGRLLRRFEPGLYLVHLNLSATSLPTYEPGSSININGLIPIFPLLRTFMISTLSLESRCRPDDLGTFLRSLPLLHTLYLHNGKYDSKTLSAMSRFSNKVAEDSTMATASLRAIHLTGTIQDEVALKAMITSYELEQLSLGGQIEIPVSASTRRSSFTQPDSLLCDIEPSQELCTWVSNRIPDSLCCSSSELHFHTSRLRPFCWRLW